jgi:hypothetical protein
MTTVAVNTESDPIQTKKHPIALKIEKNSTTLSPKKESSSVKAEVKSESKTKGIFIYIYMYMCMYIIVYICIYVYI